MATFEHKDFQDGCHNVVVECESRDEMIRLKNWCAQNIGTKKFLVNDLFESSRVLKLVVTFSQKTDAMAFIETHQPGQTGKRKTKLTLLSSITPKKPLAEVKVA